MTIGLVTAFGAAGFPNADPQSLPPDAPLKIRLEFHVEARELGELRQLLAQFADTQHLALTDWVDQMPPRQGRPVFYMELEGPDATKIVVTNIREQTRMFVWLYEYKPESNLYQLDSDLERLLKERWPTLAPYEGS